MLPSYDHLLDDDTVHQVGDLRLRTLHTPGPHAGQHLLRARRDADALHRRHALSRRSRATRTTTPTDFATIITSIDERIFGVFADDVTIWPGHGRESTVGAERPHLDEWVERGW